ncbi:OmpA/MotB family protein [Tenacibaculum finnmarkense]|uniref:OmpA family protein n=1 Tax=Tenacibaculum finnmarkense genomovar finnmarkense TaxID=1458503 RepID=A0AAP1WFQ4_9FLAO|nr:OmpA family protein [Tenacibaculum finnmarkense]MBE7652307.1 OmpA family protein [Tenacibaculum finnmarkense genomovar finnmarkense]MBE7694521.1 OmpA family protein [Tenacibaculum finnmarkense genomovar finnmarkense]MCD8426708.1 OmpA family protein [Tenacibaculum finnmarkense genomovar finnmarkense]MCG8730494.1 OmpA family protein [Tenacibaculum finnmarkense]MCG8750999.1 OmpA family protein [Tenacibaculum finnmarkense]
MKKVSVLAAVTVLTTACVSKKKYVQLEQQYKATQGTLQKTTLEKETLAAKFSKIENRVAIYNTKINSLRGINSGLRKQNDIKLDMVEGAVISNSMKIKMRKTLENVDATELANAKTLKDSMNLAVSYQLKKSINVSELENSDDINVNIDKTVVMISISDKMLFKTASYNVNRNAYKTLKKLADIIKSEPSMDVMIEGHTDSRGIHNEVIKDNWDLSVKRATSIVRILENKYGVNASRLIASGRGSSLPLVDNKTSANRARNRRTKIIILPNLNKFFGLMASEEVIQP